MLQGKITVSKKTCEVLYIRTECNAAAFRNVTVLGSEMQLINSITGTIYVSGF